MKIINTEIEGVFTIENFHASDNRGEFSKTFHAEIFSENNLCTEFRESYFSVSKKDVIRGMHFQLPPFDHEKLVYVAKGEVLDVIIDLRKNSKTFGQSISILLSEYNHKSVYIPKGCGHGFKSVVDDSIMIYNVSTVYNGDLDCGIRYDSINFDWGIENPILSNRDLTLESFEKFKLRNPF